MGMKRTKRRGMVLTGPNRGKVGDVDCVRSPDGICRVTFENGTEENLFLDAVDFVDDDDESSSFGGFTPEEAYLLEKMLG